MCRLLGAVASEHTQFHLTLREAPRSLAALSREHPDGWGIGVYSEGRGWTLERGTLSAHEDDDFHDVAAGSRGELLIAHVRKRTVGEIRLENTHPFQHGRWMFAHNGTIEDVDWLRRHTSVERLSRLEGETDSELLFAFLLTRLDALGTGAAPDSSAVERALAGALVELLQLPALGACTFLLSDGFTLYAHRLGRTLFMLERGPGDAVRLERESVETGAIVETRWSPGRRAVLIASEKMTDEPWRSIDEGRLLCVSRLPSPSFRELSLV